MLCGEGAARVGLVGLGPAVGLGGDPEGEEGGDEGCEEHGDAFDGEDGEWGAEEGRGR